MAHLKHREAKGTPRAPPPPMETKSEQRLDGGRGQNRRRSRSRSPHRGRRGEEGGWGDNTPRRDTGRKVFTGDDPYSRNGHRYDNFKF